MNAHMNAIDATYHALISVCFPRKKNSACSVGSMVTLCKNAFIHHLLATIADEPRVDIRGIKESVDAKD